MLTVKKTLILQEFRHLDVNHIRENELTMKYHRVLNSKEHV